MASSPRRESALVPTWSLDTASTSTEASLVSTVDETVTVSSDEASDKKRVTVIMGSMRGTSSYSRQFFFYGGNVRNREITLVTQSLDEASDKDSAQSVLHSVVDAVFARRKDAVFQEIGALGMDAGAYRYTRCDA